MECPKVQNKVWTAKGLRDQRCRLSPSVALQLFDIQDKLGYEQPSKAIDWLIAQAKPAIDNLPPPPLFASLQDPTFLQNLTTSSSSSICYHRNGQDSNISRSNGCHNDVFSLEQVLSRRESRDGARKELEACSKSSIMIQSMAGFLLDDDTQDNVGYPYVDHQNGYSA